MDLKFLKVPYIRVGVNYFKQIEKKDRFGVKHIELKTWNKQEIIQDYGRNYINEIPKFDDFTIEPNNAKYKRVVNNCYNMYSPFPHKSRKGSWTWTERLLRHIFGEQYELGLIYMQVMYLYPKQALPVLALVSKERQTGKSTFIDWINILFGNNVSIINPEDIGSTFNHTYATKNVVCIEETLIEKSASVEKIKSLSTQKFLTVNMKHVSQFKVPFFAKIIMASNNEDKFVKVDDEEIRFFVRKIGVPQYENHAILEDLTKEIPAFLAYLKSLPKPDFSRSRMVFTADELKNDALINVKEHSKNWLYKELVELFTDYFENEGKNEQFLHVRPVDLKRKWFEKHQNVTISWLKDVLLSDFGLVFSPKKKRIYPFNGEQVVAKYLKIERKLFTIDEEEINELFNNQEDSDLPF